MAPGEESLNGRMPPSRRAFVKGLGAAGAALSGMVVLPQWNSGPDGHVGLAKLLNRFGISALRLTMAYHAERRPAETEIPGLHRVLPVHLPARGLCHRILGELRDQLAVSGEDRNR